MPGTEGKVVAITGASGGIGPLSPLGDLRVEEWDEMIWTPCRRS